MNWRISPEEIYLENHPNSTLKEYIDYLHLEELKRSQELEESSRRHKELLASYIGKCFKIDFNGQSVIYFKLVTDLDNLISGGHAYLPTYEVYISSDKISMGFEPKRFINLMWFPNQECWYGRNNNKATIISEESYNKIVSIYENVIEAAEEVKSIKE